MDIRLAGVPVAGREKNLVHRTGRRKALRICGVIVQDGERVIKENNLIPVCSEKEEPSKIGVDVIGSELEGVCAAQPGEVVAELILSHGGFLRNIHVRSRLHRGKRYVRLIGHTQNLIHKILKVEAGHVHLGGTDVERVIQKKTMKVVVVGVASGEV